MRSPFFVFSRKDSLSWGIALLDPSTNTYIRKSARLVAKKLMELDPALTSTKLRPDTKGGAKHIAAEAYRLGYLATIEQDAPTPARLEKIIRRSLVAAGAKEAGDATRDDLMRTASVYLTGDDLFRDDPLLLDFLRGYWADGGEYLENKEARGKLASRVEPTYARENAKLIKQYVAPYPPFKEIRLSIAAASPALFNTFLLSLPRKEEGAGRGGRRKQEDGSFVHVGLSQRRINRIRQAIAVPFARAFRMKRISDNPFTAVEALTDDSRARGELTSAEADRLFAAQPARLAEEIKKKWKDERHYWANLLAAVSAMREGEILGLKKTDLEELKLADRTLYLIHVRGSWSSATKRLKGTKTDEPRTIPIPRNVFEGLQRFADSSPWKDGFIFYGADEGRPMVSGAALHGLTHALEAIGISDEERKRRKVDVHSWRHFANHALRGILPDERLRKLTGHATADMTDRYDSIQPEDLAAIASAQDTRFAGLLPEATK